MCIRDRDWSFDRKGVSHGHYYTGLYSSGNYEAAKRDFATRSGLIPEQQLFREKQLIEIYRCCTDTLQGSFELSYDQEKTIQDVRKQIEECLPDIMERIQQQSCARVKFDRCHVVSSSYCRMICLPSKPHSAAGNTACALGRAASGSRIMGE